MYHYIYIYIIIEKIETKNRKIQFRASAALPEEITGEKELIMQGEPSIKKSICLNSCATKILKYLKKEKGLMELLDNKERSYLKKEKHLMKELDDKERLYLKKEKHLMKELEDKERWFKKEVLKFKKAHLRPPIDTLGFH